MDTQALLQWPQKRAVLGVMVSATTYGEAVDAIAIAAGERAAALVTALAVHGLVTASEDPHLKGALNSFDIVGPDGQPVRWALNVIHRSGLRDRVYGPELMLRLCERAAAMGIPVYLYGSEAGVVAGLGQALHRRFPALQIVGCEPSVFRPLTPDEDAALVKRVSASGARIVFVGLGCPLQETFAFEHRDRIQAVQVCVGAAFDFHSGNKKMAPPWMQRRGLEWLYRLKEEPRRLFWRYLRTNMAFLLKMMVEVGRSKGCSKRNVT